MSRDLDQGGPVHPPRLAAWLATIRVPPEQREFVLGDLDEEFHQISSARGIRAARGWYWRQVWRAVTTHYVSVTHPPAVRRGTQMSAIIQDVRFAFRLLRRTPGFTAVVVLTLAIGIGATTAIFSVVDALLLRPLPYPHPEQLVSIYVTSATSTGGQRDVGPTYADLLGWQTLSHVFSHVGTAAGVLSRVLDAPESERLSGIRVSPDYFAVYGITPTLGRLFTNDDARPGAPPVMILGHDYWRSRLNQDRSVIGHQLKFFEGFGTAAGFATVVGVLPRSVGNTITIWEPQQMPADPSALSIGHVVARLRPEVPIDIAQRALADYSAAHPQTRSDRLNARLSVEPFVTSTPKTRWTVGVLIGAVTLVLLIACVNVASLQFARDVARRRELQIRASIGAAPSRLVCQLLTESVMMAVAAGAAGTGLAWFSLDALVAILPIPLGNAPRAIDLNPVVLAAAIVLSVTVGLSVGLLPALQLSRPNPGAALGPAPTGGGSALTRRSGRALLAVEIALALVLLSGSALMIRSFSRLHAVDLGFRPESFLTMDVRLASSTRETASSFYSALLERVRALPDVAAAGAFSPAARTTNTLTLEGAVPVSPQSSWAVRDVLPGYFETLGLRLLAGRFPTEADYSRSAPVVVVSEAAARLLFGDAPAVGRRLIVDKRQPVPREIVGIVADVRRSGPRVPSAPELYSLRTAIDTSTLALTIVARPRRTAAGVAVALRTAATSVGPRVLVPTIRTAEESFADIVAQDRQRTLLLTLLGGLGMALALAGILATTAYAVARRTKEIGIRMAIGARPGQVVREIVRDAAVPIAIGLAIGLTGALLTTRVIASFLFETTPHDPVALVSATIGLGLAGCLAAWLPARKAALVDPVATLRSD